MVQTIYKKCWPEFFESLYKGKRNGDVRLEDFRIGEGDTIIFEEWDPKLKKYTGRKIAKVCRNVMHINPTKIYSYDKLQQFGMILIDLDDMRDDNTYALGERVELDTSERVRTWADRRED